MEQISLNTETMKVANLLWPWLLILFSLVVTFWVKDLAVKIARGLSFKMNKAFNEGDEVLLDGEMAIIVKVGGQETVFGIYRDDGYTWRYVPNQRIQNLKLEKIINKNLHLDTELERAEKIKTIIDQMQDAQIAKNKEAITKIKNGDK